MTGAILPDLARVATGKESPLLRASAVSALLTTCAQPVMANCPRGKLATPPAKRRPTKPTRMLAAASMHCKNQTKVNLEPSSVWNKKTSSWRDPYHKKAT
jgi:hypothetical protein